MGQLQENSVDRINHPKMEWYREVYQGSKLWDGIESLTDKSVIVYCEQGFGDVIQMARYFKPLKDRGCWLILHCDEALAKLFLGMGCINEIVLKSNDVLPNHDFHILSLSLCELLGDPPTDYPYINISESIDLGFSGAIGLAWEGNPLQSNNSARSCPLKPLAKYFKNHKLVMLQKQIHSHKLAEGIDDIEIYGADLTDFYETAKLINSVDLVVSVDTGVLHLAGAMGKKSVGLLCSDHCDRWNVRNWYPSIRLLSQETPGSWWPVIKRI